MHTQQSKFAGKRRREAADFPGAAVILKQLKDKPKKKRVGFFSTGPPARGNKLTPLTIKNIYKSCTCITFYIGGTVIMNENGSKEIGFVTSGCPSPSLKQNISMGYVETAFAKNGTQVLFGIRKKKVSAKVAKMPFVPAKYYTGKQNTYQCIVCIYIMLISFYGGNSAMVDSVLF